MSYPEIAKRHRLPVSTCFYAVRAYLQRGLAFVNRRLTNGRPAHTIKIKEQLTGFLLTHSTLQEWSGMTLLQRCKQIRNQFGVTISPSALKRFYNRQGIKYLRTSYCYQQGMGLSKEQERFKIASTLKQGWRKRKSSCTLTKRASTAGCIRSGPGLATTSPSRSC